MGARAHGSKSVAIIIILALLSACVRNAPSPLLPGFPSTNTPFQPLRWTLTPAPTQAPSTTPSPTLSPYNIWIAPYLTESLRGEITLPAEWGYAADPGVAALQLKAGEENRVGQWVYVLAAPFPTIIDGISGEDLHALWKGETDDLLGGSPLWMAESTLEAISAFWGEPAPGLVRTSPASELVERAWAEPPSWAILPFEELNPRWKVLEIDGISPIHKDFDINDYELTLPISLIGDPPEGLYIPAINRHPDKLTTLVMTGVTALVRATAFTMERQGVTYPALDIAHWLTEADITHISNEVPFAEDCPYPNPVQQDMRFCSRDKYIGLLEEVGADIVELTGDHFGDWGAEAMLHTLELYDQEGWLTYGGGANIQEGRGAAIIEHNGNRLAFIGCNAKGGGYAGASQSSPGAAGCDFDWMAAEVERLRSEGVLPIVTFQHFEYYTYTAQPNQERDAERMTAAGALIVSGSQAHHPQAFEFSDGGLIHHGLGNLFFDQFDVSAATRQAFIDRHVFYDGRYISTELLTIMFIDYARPRPMTAAERIDLLEAVFQASGW
ncbi:MAG: CapA family protein [Chloroflexi bacterium]|nr:CapA family protein [Chloroflexota bacterium]